MSIREKNSEPDGYSAEGFFLLQELESFSFLKGVAHRRCALRVSASHLGVLVLTDGWH